MCMRFQMGKIKEWMETLTLPQDSFHKLQTSNRVIELCQIPLPSSLFFYLPCDWISDRKRSREEKLVISLL